jgi:hypothetical protein
MGNVVFNNPSEVLRKFDLLRALHLSGMNKFNVYRPGECPQKWPVFVRPENEHGGDSFVLCHSQSELDGQISELVASGKSRHSLIVTEFVDAADGNGIIRTYSILKIGDHWIPRHLFLSRNWVTRHTTIPYDDWVLEEEKHFDEVLAHSHLDQVKQVFDLAHIGYGRIDYAIVDGEIQVWEINTNPMLLPATKKKVHPQRMERTLRIARQISQAFNEIDTPDLVVTANPGKPYNTIEGGTSVSLSTHAGSMLRRRPSQASTTRQPLSRDS